MPADNKKVKEFATDEQIKELITLRLLKKFSRAFVEKKTNCYIGSLSHYERLKVKMPLDQYYEVYDFLKFGVTPLKLDGRKHHPYIAKKNEGTIANLLEAARIARNFKLEHTYSFSHHVIGTSDNPKAADPVFIFQGKNGSCYVFKEINFGYFKAFTREQLIGWKVKEVI